MKKIHFLSLVLVALSAILFISCNKDDDGDNPDVQKNEIYGEWEMVEQIDNGKTNYFEDPQCRTTFSFYRNGNLTIIDRDNSRGSCQEQKPLTIQVKINKEVIELPKGSEYNYTILRLDAKSLEITYDFIPNIDGVVHTYIEKFRKK
ncbi:lipocalin family protein [Ornithobacterium rhinotracheale]